MAIDLRSDTLTLPTQAMREAMYRAELGDDVYGEDPTVNRLQEMAAEIMGKEAALLVPTGGMGNTAAVMAHVGRGEAFIVGDQSHLYLNEQGSASTIGGAPRVVVRTDEGGMFDLREVRANINDGSDAHNAETKLLCLENTHNYCGGTVLSIAQVEALAELAHTHGLAVHMDGARIFNAATALGVPVRELVRSVDSVMFCLSKGLSAPVGSMIVGSRAFIQRAHRVRKLLGGGMRQAGILAAAGIVGLEQMVERLAEDHENSKLLAQGLADYPQIEIQPTRVVTNIVVFSLRDAAGQILGKAETDLFISKSREQGVLIGAISDEKIRAVTHYGIDSADIKSALSAIRRVLIEMGI
ncbi:MAG TPA: low-specificity L-threonine aldolase [Ktedonobacteraceae bacterium]|nr:low-specificity L-threonine aldolase [Ktedonobacteraceae bacterium]